MRISWTIPTHNRTDDLLAVLPDVITAANISPPVEIVIVDYASTPPIAPAVAHLLQGHLVDAQNTVLLREYRGRDHFHMAHARNLTIRAATGDYVVIASADIRPAEDYFALLRRRISETQAVWLTPYLRYRGIVACQREELVAAGGFDERFEFYGPEDTELEARLKRRGQPCAWYADGYLSVIPTPDAQKIRGYRLPLSKREMHRVGHAVLDDNAARGVLVANEGQAWGQW